MRMYKTHISQVYQPINITLETEKESLLFLELIQNMEIIGGDRSDAMKGLLKAIVAGLEGVIDD